MNEAQTMLYRVGTMIQCGPYSLDHITVNDSDIKATLAQGWFMTPKEAFDADQAEKEARAKQEAEDREAEQARALQAQIDANNAAIEASSNSGNGTATNPRSRKPKASKGDNAGDLGANQTENNGTNPDNPDDNNGEQE